MALEVEDGTAKANAEAYCTVVFADAYHASLGNDAWADLETAAKEQALRKAARYMDARYQFSGSKQTSEQALSWPRLGAMNKGWLVDEGSVPVAVQRACAELAFQAQTTDLAPTGAPDGAVVSETVDVLSVTYATGRAGVVVFRVVDQLLHGLIYGGSTMKISRS